MDPRLIALRRALGVGMLALLGACVPEPPPSALPTLPAVLDERQRQAVQAYREATSGADLRSKLFQGGM